MFLSLARTRRIKDVWGVFLTISLHQSDIIKNDYPARKSCQAHIAQDSAKTWGRNNSQIEIRIVDLDAS